MELSEQEKEDATDHKWSLTRFESRENEDKQQHTKDCIGGPAREELVPIRGRGETRGERERRGLEQKKNATKFC